MVTPIRFGPLEKEKNVETPGNKPPPFDDHEGADLTPPGEGFKLYRHKDAQKIRTKNWHGYYWAKRTEEGNYEIRTVPSSLGEPSASGGVFPREGFEEHYDEVSP
jgi:hypothetical protein